MSHGTTTTKEPQVYGLLAEFEQPEHLIDAVRAARIAGYRKMDAYTPFPVHGLSDHLGFHKTRLPLIVLCGAVIGAVTGFAMQYYLSVIDYPINIGGRPLNSWPAFIVITFEMTILFGGLSAVLGMLALNGLPQPYHPLFNAPNFELASRSHFFLCVEAKDPKFDVEETTRFLNALPIKPNSVAVVPTGYVEPMTATPVEPTGTTAPAAAH